MTHRRLHAFGVVVEVRTVDPQVLEMLSCRLPPVPDVAETTPPGLAYRIAGSATGQLAVLRGRRTLGTASDLATAADRLVADLQSALGRLASGWTFVHAGVVAVEGRAIVLPARSQAGKTTLVAALLRAGASYGSDEFAVLDPEGRVHPYARPLARRAADRFVTPAQLGAPVMPGGLAAGALVFVEFRGGAIPFLRRLSPGAAVLRLIEHCPGVRARPVETLRTLQALACSTPAFAGTRGEADAFARRLIQGAGTQWRTL